MSPAALRRGRKWEKGFTQKWMRLGFLCLGHLKWTNSSLKSWFCPRMCPLSKNSYWGVQFLITPLRGRHYVRKRNSPKMEETQGFMYLGYSTWIICKLLSWFCPKYFPLSYHSLLGSPIPYYPIERKAVRQNKRKGTSPEMVSLSGIFKLDHLHPVELILSQFFPPLSHHSYWGVQFLITPERKTEYDKMELTQNRLVARGTWGYPNWTICSQLSWFISFLSFLEFTFLT